MSLRREESLRSQKRENLATLGKVKVSHTESEQFSERAQREYDKWFFSLPADQQAKLREGGAEPYCEQGDPRRRLCQLFTNSASFAYEQTETHTESQTFYSREKVLDILRSILETLSSSNDHAVRLHFEFIKTVIKAPGSLDGAQIGKLYGLTRAAVNLRVLKMRASLASALQTLGMQSEARPGKESPRPPAPRRRVPHREEKTRASCQKPRGARK